MLSVREVYALESFLSNEKNLIVDRFDAGCFLFALFSRSRWSDLRCVYGYAPDILEVEGKITGYLEYKTRSHKTARLVQKPRSFHAASGPSLGGRKDAVGLRKVSKLPERHTFHNIPSLPAPTEDGRWTNRSLTSTLEAKKWLLSVLSRSLDRDRNPLPEEHSSQLGRKSWIKCGHDKF